MTKQLQRSNPVAIQLFSLIGLLPAGVYERDLTRIWGNEKWFVLAEILIQASLLQFEVEEKHSQHHGQRKYRLMQFLNKFAAGLVPQSKLRDLHERICQQYLKKIGFYFANCCVEAMRDHQAQH